MYVDYTALNRQQLHVTKFNEFEAKITEFFRNVHCYKYAIILVMNCVVPENIPTPLRKGLEIL